MASLHKAVAQMQSFPKSDDFAVLLDLTISKIGTPPARSEQHKVDVINLLYIPRLHLESHLQQEVVFSRFAAIYLRDLVEKYINPPAPSTAKVWNRSVAFADMKLANAYGYMLYHLNSNPYFDKFFRLPQHYALRQQLIEQLLLRLSERTYDWEERVHNPGRTSSEGGISIQSMIHNFCELTASLLLFHSEQDTYNLAQLPHVRHLQNFLQMWNDRYAPGDISGISASSSSSSEKTFGQNDVAGRSKAGQTASKGRRQPDKREWPAYQLKMILMNGNDEKELAAITAARLSKKGPQVCGLISCTRTLAKDGYSLLQCSQCGTVRYCCEDHQRQAWEHPKIEHRMMCYRTAF